MQGVVQPHIPQLDWKLLVLLVIAVRRLAILLRFEISDAGPAPL